MFRFTIRDVLWLVVVVAVATIRRTNLVSQPPRQRPRQKPKQARRKDTTIQPPLLAMPKPLSHRC